MHDSLTAPGGGISLFLMMLGEIAPGGVGSGLYGMLMLAVVTVFLSGLMVGRTPEYLGVRIGSARSAWSRSTSAHPGAGARRQRRRAQRARRPGGLQEGGPHGLTEAVYAVTSASNNNGSAFGGLTSGTPFWNTLLGLCMLLGRFVPIVVVLALAGRFAAAGRSPRGAGTLPPTRPLRHPAVGGRAGARRSDLRARARPRPDRGVPVMSVLTAAQLGGALPARCASSTRASCSPPR